MAGTCDLLRGRKRIVTAKVETNEGEDSTPTPAANAILVNSVEVQPQPNLLQANELTGKLDAGEFDIGGFPLQVPIAVNCKPGPDGATEPEAGVLLKACGLQVATNTEKMGTATGGTTKTLTLNRSIDTDFPATDGALVGQPIIIGFGGGDVLATIISYAVSGSTVTIGLSVTLDTPPTTEDVTVPANITYRPYEGCPPTLTIYVYEDGILWKILGCRGNAEWTVDAGGRAVMTCTFTGFFGGKTDVPLPTDTVAYQDVRPGIWKDGIMTVDSARAAVQQLTTNLGNTLPYPGDPNEPEGFLPPIITGRDIQGQINPFETLTATRNIFVDFRNGTKRAIAAAMQRETDGHWTAFTFPAGKYRNASPTDRDGLDAVSAPFSAINESAEHPEKGDSGFYLAFFYEPVGS